LFRLKAMQLARQSGNGDEEVLAEAMQTIRELVEDIKRALDRFRFLRTEQTKAPRAVSQAGQYVDEVSEAIADGVAEMMGIIDGLIDHGSQIAA
jgi:nitrogen fixation/metabolism regulation signal transduction histidine kinase